MAGASAPGGGAAPCSPPHVRFRLRASLPPPPVHALRTMSEPAREVPMVAKCDLARFGAGPAGAGEEGQAAVLEKLTETARPATEILKTSRLSA